MLLTEAQKHRFEKDPAKYIQKTIRDYIARSPNNRFSLFPEEPIFDEPLVGFADGDDPLFREYKTIIGNFHITPREALDLPKYMKTML